MFSTFQAAGSTGAGDGDGKANRPGGNSRRISTSNACIEYVMETLLAVNVNGISIQRSAPMRNQHRGLCPLGIARLFPGKELEELLSLPREELVSLAVTIPTSNPSPFNTPGPLPSVIERVNNSETAESLEALEQAPEQDPPTDEAKRLGAKIQGISDDVNGLSLSVDRTSSYVGVSSIPAVLKVIFKTAPFARAFVSQNTANPSRSTTPPPHLAEPDPNYLPPADIGEKLIDSYFAHIHLLMPMIDEDSFRHCYLYSMRRDSPWLGLLNMVMALGSLAGSTCDSEDHIAYYQRARKHLEAEGFGSGSLFVLQAFGLLSGYYLHWLNRPNEANAMLGATLRMATAHGLHREYGNPQNGSVVGSTMIVSGLEVPVEIKRRTWWSLFCLDLWASIATGRPSLGRTGPGITTAVPRIPEQMNNAQYLASLRLLPIIHNIAFCKIATKLQDQLAARTLIEFEELFALDAELEKWREDLPPIMRDVVNRPDSKKRTFPSNQKEQKHSPPNPGKPARSKKASFDFSQPPERDNTSCPEVLKTPRAIMHWRYQNLKMLMHRPILLAAVLRRTSFAKMKPEEKVAVSRCRIVAGQAIADIIDTCQDHLISGWNAVWLMYQAVMVPIVSLFSVLTLPPSAATNDSPHGTLESGFEHTNPTGTDNDVEHWKLEVEKAIVFFKRMERWSVAARKSGDVVQRLYDATKYVSQYNQQQQAPSGGHAISTDSNRVMLAGPYDPNDTGNFSQDYGMNLSTGWGISPNGEAAVNEFWNDMMWDSFPSDANFVVDQTDWWQQNVEDQDWSQWPGEEGV
ncbi:uncharacterized protein RCC_04864 [Ramularia collo-cygni]|uniref:Xylanolytic transcriptional activator regulatory domain-containing protein n=1 Tax=Ramularia collo-cygni TaxID=112498 RepID=A0A2D3VBP5_9PEZI|nr:uncharacterized protein RCC_04864 [Ramularia collo-cygni]CZT19019.1 uncharacterized protein RCC_04864 [Ramularia collo-cygni]